MNHTLIPNITNYSEFCNTTVHTGKKEKKVYEEKEHWNQHWESRFFHDRHLSSDSGYVFLPSSDFYIIRERTSLLSVGTGEKNF